jgi:XTP/dITP diphosphohydrolase
MKIYFASGNLHKKQEMQALFPEFQLVIPSEEGINFDPEETGTSFLGNSLIKAQDLWNKVHQPVLADDSGICVDILKGIPGIYSARYGGKDFPQGRQDGTKPSQDEQNQFLIQQTDEVIKELVAQGKALPENPRSCRYVCAMVLYLGPQRFYSAQETMEGSLIQSLDLSRGTGGFGYDPIVILAGTDKTIAQLSSQEKNALSHRGKAARGLHQILLSLVQPSNN